LTVGEEAGVGGSRPAPEHGFTGVDDQPDPHAWVGVLDRLDREPFYRAYKARIVELLDPVAGGLYLDVGGGTGAAARALVATLGGATRAVVIDRSATMAAEAGRRGSLAAVGTAEALPVATAAVDGCWADRTFQHLADPGRALAELRRVTRPGGRVVTVDPDYGTQVVGVDDQELARRVLRLRADHLLRNGTLAHRMPALFAAAGLAEVRVEAMTLVVRDPTAVDNVLGLRTWAATGHRRGLLSAEDAAAWPEAVDRAVTAGRFLYAVTFFLTAGTRASARAPGHDG
jgi:SAM-dependent methyltransferase